MPSFLDAIGKVLRGGLQATGGTAVQDALGFGAGLYESGGRLPTAGPEGTFMFRSGNPEAMPRALGSSIIAGRDPDPVELAHELRHVKQSRTLGPAYLPLAAMGGDLGSLEEDAYRATEPQGSPVLSNRAQFQRAAGVSPNQTFMGALSSLLR